MKKVAIVTDSNSGITQEEAKKLGVKVIPMPFIVNGEEYFEDVNLSQAEFFERLKQNADISTSQPAIGGVTELWQELLKEYDEIVHIPMSSGLSESMNTARNFSKEFGGKVQVVDNHRISITQKRSVMDAVKLANEGHDAREIKDYLEKTAADSSIYIMVDTLKYLKKGGRITPAAALIGAALSIKPVLTIQGGKLDKFGKVMNVKAAKVKMISAIKDDIEKRFKDLFSSGKMRIAVAHTNNYAKADEFAKEIEDAFDVKVEFVDPLALSIACHIGDGALAIGCYRVHE